MDHNDLQRIAVDATADPQLLRAALWVAMGERLEAVLDASRSQVDAGKARVDTEWAVKGRDEAVALAANRTAERDIARSEAAVLRADLAQSRDECRVKVERLTRERDALQRERDAAVTDAEVRAVERDAAHAARDREVAAHALTLAELRTARQHLATAHAEIAGLNGEVARLTQERDRARYGRAEAIAERDDARATSDGLRTTHTFDERKVAPTRGELEAHKANCGQWLVTWPEPPDAALNTEVVAGVWPTGTYPEGATYIPLDATGSPCWWPVAPSATPT